MTDKPDGAPNERIPETIVVNGRYIREQANAALKLFVAPLSGVYDAAFGPVSTPVEPPSPQSTKRKS